MFSVDEHPADPNVLIFYEGGDPDRGFHHPTEWDFEYENHGFHKFLEEQLSPKKYNVSGGLMGGYKIENDQIKIRWADNHLTYKQDILKELIDKKLACGILHCFEERILS